METRNVTKSGAFVATVFALVVALVPFGLEQVGETTGLFSFPATKTVKGWFSPSAGRGSPSAAARPVDWERYRRDLEEFSEWADGRAAASVSLPPVEVAEIQVVEDERPERRLWLVPVSACTAADPASGHRGYVFVSGFDRAFAEGAEIAPTDSLCGYEIVSVGERSVWFRAVFDAEGDSPAGAVRLPEFTRVDGDGLVRGRRRYSARDAFPLASGGWLMIDSFLPPDGAVFKVLDESRRSVATFLCVVIGEKGGR